jgi:hypothetical protein
MSIQSINQSPVQTSVATAQSAQSSKSATPSTSESKPASSSSYTVSISNAAHAALLEATESSVQTQKEANHGDLQAQHLLAKEQAAKAE